MTEIEVLESEAAGPASDDVPNAVPVLDARVERVLVAPGGLVLVFGWVSDEGYGGLGCRLLMNGRPMTIESLHVLRHRRPDVETVQSVAAYDFGFAAIAKIEAADGPPSALVLSAGPRAGSFTIDADHIPERRLLEELLAFLGAFQAHRGREVALQRFLAEGGRALILALVHRGQAAAARIQLTARFGPDRSGPTFVTVLFGSIDAVLFQPLLFAKAGIAFGEWLYVCNSPEQADDLMRLARLTSKLHDLPICVAVLNGNAGFGGANNLAIPMAASREVVLINPDVHPIVAASSLLNRALQTDRFGRTLRGGLLFYDDDMLMHGGMYLDEDVFGGRDPHGSTDTTCRLLRVEHHDKGIPFLPENWAQPRRVPAVTGAVMAFERGCFEKVGGFSEDFIFGHYEDADLCLRWGESVGPVEVDPDIRLVHLEGLGSKTRLPHFHGAMILNRHSFELRNRRFAASGKPGDQVVRR